jgi:hypothetical protein
MISLFNYDRMVKSAEQQTDYLKDRYKDYVMDCKANNKAYYSESAYIYTFNEWLNDH